jgi:hypothetical protein
LVEIQYCPLRPEIQAFALQKCHFVAAFAGYFRGLCSVYVVFRCWFGIVKSFTEFQPNKIHYLAHGQGFSKVRILEAKDKGTQIRANLAQMCADNNHL